MNRLKHIVGAVCLLALFIIPQQVLGAGFQENTQSAVSTGMANIGVANPKEPNSSFYNPAAMSFRDELHSTAGLSLIYPTIEYEPFDDGESVDNEKAIHPLPNFHLGYPVNEELALGIGLTAPYGLVVEWPENWVGRETNEFVEIASVNLTPNVSYEIPDTGLSVAGGAQLAYSWVELRRDIQTRSDDYVQSELGGDGFGIGGLAALMYRPTEELTFGAQYRSRVNVSYDDARVHFEDEEDTPFYSTFRDNPGSTEITFPDTINAGVNYGKDRWMAEFDVNYTMWDTFDVVDVDIDTGDDEEAIDGFELEQNWENAFAFRLGGQYDVTPEVPVRLGAALDLTPVPDETVNATLPDNDRLVGSIGSGYHADPFQFDLSYMLVRPFEREVENEEGPPGNYSMWGHVLGANVSYNY